MRYYIIPTEDFSFTALQWLGNSVHWTAKNALITFKLLNGWISTESSRFNLIYTIQSALQFSTLAAGLPKTIVACVPTFFIALKNVGVGAKTVDGFISTKLSLVSYAAALGWLTTPLYQIASIFPSQIYRILEYDIQKRVLGRVVRAIYHQPTERELEPQSWWHWRWGQG